MNLLFLQGFNNYYNRVVKKFNTLNDYTTWAANNNKNTQPFDNINFVPNDGIDTTQIVNWNETWTPDYLIVTDGPNISRWFVMDFIRTQRISI